MNKKLAGLAIPGAIALPTAVAAVRAAKIKAKPNTSKPAISFTKEEEDKYAHMLSEMIKVPTVSLRCNDDLTEFRKLQKVMEELFPLIHKNLEKVDLEGNLLFRWKGKNPELEGILLMGHQDVVTADEVNWEHDPFSGDICDGKIHGRGAMDCKCTVMAEFAAVEELLAEGFEPERDIYLACSVNEEIGGTGAPMTVAYLKEKGVRLAVVMDEGGAIVQDVIPGMTTDCAAVGIVEKGYVDLKFIASGAGGHSSTPPRDTPIARLSAFVTEVEKKRPFKKKITEPCEVMFKSCAPYLGFGFRFVLANMKVFEPVLTKVLPLVSPFAEAFIATTCVFTMCGGSRTPNVIPDEAYVIANIRPAIHQDAEESIEILKKIAKKYDLRCEIIRSTPVSAVSSPDSDELKYLHDCVTACCPDVCFTPYYITGGTDCRNYQEVCDNCLRFCPIRMDPQQQSAMHAANENIGTAAVAEGVKFYKYFLKNHK